MNKKIIGYLLLFSFLFSIVSVNNIAVVFGTAVADQNLIWYNFDQLEDLNYEWIEFYSDSTEYFFDNTNQNNFPLEWYFTELSPPLYLNNDTHTWIQSENGLFVFNYTFDIRFSVLAASGNIQSIAGQNETDPSGFGLRATDAAQDHFESHAMSVVNNNNAGDLNVSTWYSCSLVGIVDNVTSIDQTAMSFNLLMYDQGFLGNPANLLSNSTGGGTNAGGNENNWSDGDGFSINWWGSVGNREFYLDNQELSFLGISPLFEVDGENFNTIVGEPDFVFVDWKYYSFNVTIPDSMLNSTDIDFVFVRFDLPTYEGWITIAPYWENDTIDFWGLITNSTIDIDRSGEPVLTRSGYSLELVNATEFIFRLFFEDKCLDVWDPLDCIDVDVAWNETDGFSSAWFSFNNAFRVYNDGAFPDDVTITGNAGVLPGGRDLSMFAYNESSVLKEVVWRDAVHIKLQPTTHFRAGYSDWDQYYSLDYMLEDGTQIPGLQLLIEPSYVAYSGVFASNIWINMTVSWYGNSSLIKSDVLYMFYHGSVFNTGDAGRWGFWVDLWFDNQNGSQVMGGRINAYEYPVEDGSAAWLRWLSSNWGAKDNVTKQSECFTPIVDSNGNTVSAENVKFVVLQSILTVPGVSGSDQYIAIADFGVYDVSLAQQLPMRGISSPPWDETQMPTVGNSGLVGAIFSLFSGIGGWLSENVLFGGLNLWGNFVAFLDTIAGWLGAPGFFSWLFDQIAGGLAYLYAGALQTVDMLVPMFLLIGEVLGTFVTIVSDIITGFVNTLTIFTDMMAGGYGAGVNVWNDLGISTWISIGIVFYPLYLLWLWEKEGLDAVMQQLGWIFGLFVAIYKLLEGIILGVVQLITSLIESIPVAE
jgi:hypothetical protein